MPTRGATAEITEPVPWLERASKSLKVSVRMAGPFHVERLIESGLSERLQQVLDEARQMLSLRFVFVAELAAAEGRLMPRWRAASPAAVACAPPSLDAYGALAHTEGSLSEASALETLGPFALGATITLRPLALSPRVSAQLPDALLFLGHACAEPLARPLLDSLVRCLERGLSHERRTRLAEVVFQAVEQAADPIELTDQEAHLLYANAAWEQTFGHAREESLGKTVGSLFRDPATPVHDRAFYQFTLATLAGGRAWTGALACRARDGRRVFCEPMVSPFAAPEQGFVGNFAVRRDLAQRMERDRALVVAHHEFRAVLAAIPDGAAVLRDGAIYFANAALLAILGRIEEDVIGLAYVDFVHPDDAARFLQEHQQGITRVRLVRDDGTLRFAEITTAGAVSFEGKPAMILLARDMTDHRVAQEQLLRAEKLSALGALAAGIAHEINNPLAYVLLNLEFVREGALLADAEQSALLEAAAGAERIREIVSELRAYSGQDSTGPPEPVDVAKAIASAVNIAQNEIRHRARLERDLEQGLSVLAREGQLVQVLVNLLVNAAQAIVPAPTPPGQSARVSVSARQVADMVEIVVSDTGAGIPAAMLPHVFDAFSTSKPRGEGSGLGLAISKRIVESLGGRIGIESEPGIGTTVTLLLPAAESTSLSLGSGAVLSRAAPRLSGRVPSGQPRARVLVVDDERAVAAGIVRMLPQHDVATAPDSQTALSLLQSSPAFDVVLCDLMMPGMTGPDFYRAACQHDPGLADRFVFMTGGAFTDWARAFLDRTSCPVLTKPFPIASVVDVVDRMLNQTTARASG